jgi:hypothetical protein
MRNRLLFLTLAVALAATPQDKPKSLLGAVAGFRPEALELTVKPDQGEPVAVPFGPQTQFQRIAPGERDLSKAQPIEPTSLRTGDRVLVSFVPGTPEARRILVMSASDIAQRNEADRLDWQRRGLSGVVASRKDNEITLRARGFQGETIYTVTVSPSTTFKRYAPDSVKFADAKPAKLSDVKPGDQLRARGVKSADGNSVQAEEVVFGAFQTRAGTVESLDPAARTLTIKDSATGKSFLVKLTPDSQLKAMPEFAAMMMSGRGPGPGGPGGPPEGRMPAGPPPGAGPRGGGFPGGPPEGGPPGGFRGPRPGGPPDFAQMIERMPPIPLEQIKTGETIVVSSTIGAKKDELTAIMLLANAEALVQMVSRMNAARGGPNMAGPGMNGPGIGIGMGGFELPSMMP